MKKLIKVYPYILIVLFSVLMFYKIFRPGFMVFLDNPSHLSMYQYYIENIILNQNFIFGFNPSDFAGFPIGSIYSQIGFILLTPMNLILKIRLELAYKILVFFAYLTPSLLIYFICLKHFSKIPSLTVSLIYLITWKDVVLTVFGGMWTYYIGISFLLVFLYFLLKFYEKSSFKYVLILSLLLSLIILSHPFATFAALYLMFSFFLANLILRKSCVKRTTLGLGVALLISVLITAVYTFPLVSDLSPWLRSYAWGLATNYPQTIYRLLLPLAFAVPQNLMVSDLVNPLLGHNYSIFFKNAWQFFVASFPQLIVLIFTIIGLRSYIKTKKDSSDKMFFLTSLLIFSIISIIVSSGFWHLHEFLHNIPILSGLISHRFQIYTEIGMLVFAAYGMTEVWKKRVFTGKIFRYRNIIALVLLLFVLINFSSYYPSEKIVRTSGSSELFSNEVMPMWEWIKSNIDGKETRVLFQSFWRNAEDGYDSDSINAMSIHFTNVNYIGGWTGGTPNPTEFYLTSTKGNRILGKTIETISDDEIVERLKMLNVKYIIAIEPKLKEKLESSNNFKKEKSIRRFDIYSLEDYDPEWVEFKYPTEYEITNFESQNINIEINNKGSNEVLIKVANNPYWKAYVNGNEVEIEDNGFGLMNIGLENAEKISLKLEYNPRKPVYIAITIFGILLLIFISLYYNITRNKVI